jgi:hypothetical protein
MIERQAHLSPDSRNKLVDSVTHTEIPRGGASNPTLEGDADQLLDEAVRLRESLTRLSLILCSPVGVSEEAQWLLRVQQGLMQSLLEVLRKRYELLNLPDYFNY